MVEKREVNGAYVAPNRKFIGKYLTEWRHAPKWINVSVSMVGHGCGPQTGMPKTSPARAVHHDPFACVSELFGRRNSQQ